MGSDAVNPAAHGGHLEVLIWLKEVRQMGDTRAAMLLALREGNFEVIEWLRDNGGLTQIKIVLWV